MTTLIEKLISHVESCEIVKPCVTIDEEKLRCTQCSFNVMRQNPKHFIYKVMQHFGTEKHKEICCWTLTRDGNQFLTKSLKSKVHMTLDSFIKPAVPFEKIQQPGSLKMDDVQVPLEAEPTPVSADSVPQHSSRATDYIDSSIQASPVTKNVILQASASSSDTSVQCCETFADGVKNFLITECDMNLRADFKTSDLKETLKTFPLIKISLENAMQRKNPFARHSSGIKDHVVKSALLHSQHSAVDWSTALGGPRKSTIKSACKPANKILPYIDIDNMEQHILKFKLMLGSLTTMNVEDIPIIAALDATAVTGRMFSRSSEGDKLYLERPDYRYLYGLAQKNGPFQQTRLVLEKVEGRKSLKLNDEFFMVNGLGSFDKLFAEEKIKRATSYMVIILVPLIEEPRPYAIGMFPVSKGFDSNQRLSVHRQLSCSMKKMNLQLISCPGDGDPTLRLIQWNYFTSKVKLDWLSELVVPVQVFFDDKGTFPFQDMFHNAKKLRNNLTYTESRCLALGLDISIEESLVMRWDYVYKLIIKNPQLLQHCSLSGLNFTDKQDPSLVADVSCLYKYFLDAGYSALGMYLKCTHLLIEAFLDKSLTPEERIYKAYYTKSFFFQWSLVMGVNSCHFISYQTYHDVCCCVDGLVLYLLTLMQLFPKAPVVPFFLGSDSCEQVFAFIRISRYSGRRTNLDADVLAFGLERRNVCSELTMTEPMFAAHTRGRQVLKSTVPLPNEVDSDTQTTPKSFYGKDIKELTLKNTMKKATNDCFRHCKDLHLDSFITADLNVMPRNVSPHYDLTLLNDDEDANDEELQDQDMAPVEDLPADESDTSVINTPMGKMHIKTAESIYLNGGKITLGARSRKSRFYGKTVFEGNPFNAFKDSKECCENCISLVTLSLKTFKDSAVVITGSVRFISIQHHPLKIACPEHTGKNKFNIWLWVRQQKSYVRCVY